jgi:hypothetical protein
MFASQFDVDRGESLRTRVEELVSANIARLRGSDDDREAAKAEIKATVQEEYGFIETFFVVALISLAISKLTS